MVMNYPLAFRQLSLDCDVKATLCIPVQIALPDSSAQSQDSHGAVSPCVTGLE